MLHQIWLNLTIVFTIYLLWRIMKALENISQLSFHIEFEEEEEEEDKT